MISKRSTPSWQTWDSQVSGSIGHTHTRARSLNSRQGNTFHSWSGGGNPVFSTVCLKQANICWQPVEIIICVGVKACRYRVTTKSQDSSQNSISIHTHIYPTLSALRDIIRRQLFFKGRKVSVQRLTRLRSSWSENTDIGLSCLCICVPVCFLGVWAFLWFVCFCLLANQWSHTQDTRGIPLDAARAIVAFSFFSIASWVRILSFWTLLNLYHNHRLNVSTRAGKIRSRIH